MNEGTFGGEIPNFNRLITGIHILDKAFENLEWNEIGIPIGMMELYGPTGCGKTTLSWFFAAEAGKQLKKNVVMWNIEKFDPRYLQSCFGFYGYTGHTQLAKGSTDEQKMDDVETFIKMKDYGIYILDSVGAISPIAEMDSVSGTANMGRRAKLMAAHSRKLNHYETTKDLMSIIINHVHQNLGGLGTSTTGGSTIWYLSSTRVRVKRKKDFSDGSFVIEGAVAKNRFGVEDRKFWVVVLAGRGVHKGLSNAFSCIQLKLIKEDKRSLVWADGREGKISWKGLVEQARTGNDEAFQVFQDALSGSNVIATDELDENE